MESIFNHLIKEREPYYEHTLEVFQMSVAGGVLILFIVVIRALAIHRLPKTTFLALWMICLLYTSRCV